MSKADNMLAILWLLKSEKKMTAKQLSDELEIHIRTVYRYIDALCASGVPIVSDSGHNGGYSLLHNFTKAPLFFDLNEQKALIHAAKFAQEAGYPFGDALSQAITKLKTYTNKEQLSQINRHEAHFDVINPSKNSVHESVLQVLEVSVANACTLQMDYQKGNSEHVQTRRIDPYGLVYWKGNWYITAYCHLREEIRSFRVDRIHVLYRTELQFERPPEFNAREHFLNMLLPDEEQMEDMVSVRIQARPRIINYLADHWLFNQSIVEQTEDTLHIKMHESTLHDFAPYTLLSYGQQLQILEPLSLRERLSCIAAELYEHYRTV
ncbi:helix-turn-helix transcriptional regulator [Paenibacillus solisilvae]|uniref:Helix-turn-helix transcriptional regulator n=1 Tax=Paenibacillus solisilvae TaxID=2486751 RepID=A0ABW0VU22_9BACL